MSILLSARHLIHSTPAVCAKKTALHTRSKCARPTQPPSKTNAFLNWRCAGWRATTLYTTQEVALVRRDFILIYFNFTSTRLFKIFKLLLVLTQSDERLLILDVHFQPVQSVAVLAMYYLWLIHDRLCFHRFSCPKRTRIIKTRRLLGWDGLWKGYFPAVFVLPRQRSARADHDQSLELHQDKLRTWGYCLLGGKCKLPEF